MVAAFVALGVLASTLVAGGGDNRLVEASIGGLALVGVAWLAGENTRASRAYASRMASRAAEKEVALRAERAEQVRRAVAEERVEIARELHDIVAHAMSVIAVRSGVARMVLDTRPDQAREALGIIETTTRRSLQEMRLLVSVLRDDADHPAELGPLPGMDDLDRLVAEVTAAGIQDRGPDRGGASGSASCGQSLGLPDRARGADQCCSPRRTDHRAPRDQIPS